MKNFLKILVLFFAITAVQSAFGCTWVDEERNCPVCNNNFKISVKTIYSSITQMKDMQNTGSYGDYYYILIINCPKCRYSGHHKVDFNTTFLEDTKQ